MHHEQTKLPTTALNTIAVDLIVIGLRMPVTAFSFGVATAPPIKPTPLLFALL